MLESANSTNQRVPVADILETGGGGAAASGSTSTAEPKQTSKVSYCLLNIKMENIYQRMT